MNIDLSTGFVTLAMPAVVLQPGTMLEDLVNAGVAHQPQAVGEICNESGLRITERSNLIKAVDNHDMRGMTFMLTLVVDQDALVSLAFKNADNFGDSLGLELWNTERKRFASHREWLGDWLGEPSATKGCNAQWAFDWGRIFTYYDEVSWGGVIFVDYANDD